MSQLAAHKVLVLTALQGGRVVPRSELSKLPGCEKKSLSNAIFALIDMKVIDRRPGGFVIVNAAKAAEIIASTTNPAPNKTHERAAQHTALERSKGTAARPDDSIAREPSKPPVELDGDPSVLFAINELGEIEVSRRDGEGSVVPIPAAEIPRLLQFIDVATKVREKLLREMVPA